VSLMHTFVFIMRIQTKVRSSWITIYSANAIGNERYKFESDL